MTLNEPSSDGASVSEQPAVGRARDLIDEAVGAEMKAALAVADAIAMLVERADPSTVPDAAAQQELVTSESTELHSAGSAVSKEAVEFAPPEQEANEKTSEADLESDLEEKTAVAEPGSAFQAEVPAPTNPMAPETAFDGDEPPTTYSTEPDLGSEDELLNEHFEARESDAPQDQPVVQEDEEDAVLNEQQDYLRDVVPSTTAEPIELSDTEDEEEEIHAEHSEVSVEEEEEDDDLTESKPFVAALEEPSSTTTLLPSRTFEEVEEDDLTESEPFSAALEEPSMTTTLLPRDSELPTLDDLVPLQGRGEQSESSEWGEDVESSGTESEDDGDGDIQTLPNATVIECLTSDDEDEDLSATVAAPYKAAVVERAHELERQTAESPRVTLVEAARPSPADGSGQMDGVAGGFSSLAASPAVATLRVSQSTIQAAVAETTDSSDRSGRVALDSGHEPQSLKAPGSAAASVHDAARGTDVDDLEADNRQDKVNSSEEEETKQAAVSPPPIPAPPETALTAAPPPVRVPSPPPLETKATVASVVSRQLIPIAVPAELSNAAISVIPRGSQPVDTVLPPRPEKRSWGASFGLAGRTPARASSLLLSAASPAQTTSPLNSWFLSKGHANFIQRVVFPPRLAAAADRLHRRRSLSPRRQQPSSGASGSTSITVATQNDQLARVLESAATAFASSQGDDGRDASGSNAFLDALARQSSWRSWYGSVDQSNLLDPPLEHASADVRAAFDVDAAFTTTGGDDEDDTGASDPPTTGAGIARLEVEIKCVQWWSDCVAVASGDLMTHTVSLCVCTCVSERRKFARKRLTRSCCRCCRAGRCRLGRRDSSGT